MRFNIVTLFPEFFDSPLAAGLLGKAQENGLVDVVRYNPRDYSLDKHHKVDDRPFGGGPGMVMLLDPVVRCLRAIESLELGKTVESAADKRVGAEADMKNAYSDTTSLQVESTKTSRATSALGKLVLLTPAGKPFNQQMARELASEESLTIVCGRYEGFDARLEELFDFCPVSLGDFVLNGGESAALSVIESVGRLLPGFMGHEDSGDEESFSHGLLEYPHYTRPELFEGSGVALAVPEVLRGGNHAAIAKWRREQALLKTLEHRPDLLCGADLVASDIDILAQKTRLKRGRNLACALVHHPVTGKDGKSCTVSLTNLDIHDIARSSCTFGLGRFYVSTPLEDQRRLLDDITGHWTLGAGAKANPDRADALSLVCGVDSLDEAILHMESQYGQRPLLVGTSAKLPQAKRGRSGRKLAQPGMISFEATADLLLERPVLLVFGTGHGLHQKLIEGFDYMLPPIRPVGYNHLSVRSAVAIVLDRILGDWL